MNFNTAMSHIITLVISIIGFICNIVKEDKKKIAWICVFGAIILTVVLCCCTVSSRKEKEANFENKIKEANDQLKNYNFTSAAEYYNEAFKFSYNFHSEAHALQREASAYMCKGIIEKDTHYLNHALETYKNVLNNPRYRYTYAFKESLIDVCNLYLNLGYNWDNEEWCNYVEKVKEIYCFEEINRMLTETDKNNAKISKSDLANSLAVAQFLSNYYEVKYKSNLDSSKNDFESRRSQLYYLETALKIKEKYIEDYNNRYYDDEYFYLVYRLNTKKLDYAFFSADKNSLTVFQKARESCQNAISLLELEDGNSNPMANYIELKMVIGKSYIFSEKSM